MAFKYDIFILKTGILTSDWRKIYPSTEFEILTAVTMKSAVFWEVTS
jgi:hypothetical protein